MQVCDDEGASLGPVQRAGEISHQRNTGYRNLSPVFRLRERVPPTIGSTGNEWLRGAHQDPSRPLASGAFPYGRFDRAKATGLWCSDGPHCIASFTSSASASASSASDASP